MEEISSVANRRSFVRRVWGSRWRWAIILVAAAAAIYGVAHSRGKGAPTYTTATVERQDLRQIVQADGSVESTKAIELSFNAGGTIASVNAAVGKKVRTGELLASVASQKQEAQVAVAQGALQAAQADLLRVTSGASQEDLDVANQRVIQAQSALSAIQRQQASDVASWRTSLWQSLSANAAVGTRAANEAHRVLTDDEANSLLVVLAPSDDSLAKSHDAAVRGRMAQLSSQVAGGMPADDVAVADANDMLAGLRDVQSLLNETVALLQRMYPANSFTQDDLNTLKSAVATQQGYVATAAAAVESARAALVNGEAANATQLDAATSALNLAQAQARATAAPARQFELAQAQAKVAQARGDLERATATLEDYRLRAPVDGVVTRVDIHPGQQGTVGVPVVAILGSVPLQIKVKVAEADIAKVQVGQTATITLDAFGDSRPFSGTVGAVDQSPTLVDGVVYYNVTAVFVGDAADVKLGMSASVDILTAQRQQVLVAPSRSIRSRSGELYVQVPNAQGKLDERTVTVGLRGEDGLVEVLTGLSEGDSVVTLSKAP